MRLGQMQLPKSTSLSKVSMRLQTLLAVSSNLFVMTQCSSPLNLSTTWDILGPFQIGTREAEWGADPLEKYGGFRNLTYDTTSRFKSSLPINGVAQWSQTQLSAQNTNYTRGTVTVGFENVDWDNLRSIYGWSGIQFQAWARGSLDVCADAQSDQTTIILHVWNVGEFWIDDMQYFGGDFYGYRRAPVVLQLAPGRHKFDVRVTHDIRNFGGGMPPRIAFEVEAKVSPGGLIVVPEGAVVSDLVEGRIAGKWASVPLRNDAVNWIEVLEIVSVDNTTQLSFAHDYLPLGFAPGQTRPVKFRVEQLGSNATDIALKFRYRAKGQLGSQWVPFTRELNKISRWYLPQKYTYLHPSGVVSYAVIRPPSPTAPCAPNPDNKLPILLALHGAGVEADNPQSKEQYNALPDLCSWLVLPSGVTSWSGDDWHVWGFADVEAGINAIPEWMHQVGWERQGIDLEKWVISGHSNGGQGTWYGLTHRSDKIIAAAPLSGYLSIPAYVPYHMWHEADPRKMAIVLASLNTYKHELLASNMVGTPILQQHGQEDDNVPAFHSRRMSQLVSEVGWETKYWEIPGKGHWWEGVMTDGGLSLFLKYYLQENPVIQPLPDRFSIVVASPADMGPRGGIVIDQLDIPDQFGRIDVKISGGTGTWNLKTFNIRRWHFQKSPTNLPSRVIIDDQEFDISIPSGSMSSHWFVASEDGIWLIASSPDWKLRERSSQQSGALDAILSSKSRFSIILPKESGNSSYYNDVALDISRNLFQYFAADTEIFANSSESIAIDGNLIILGFPSEIGINIPQLGREFPIAKLGNAIAITDVWGRQRTYPMEPGMGLIYLHPLPDERLALIIWGTDEEGLRTAARLLPLRTGVGQPNFVMGGKEMRWSGVAGVKAIGMFDSWWRVSHTSYL